MLDHNCHGPGPWPEYIDGVIVTPQQAGLPIETEELFGAVRGETAREGGAERQLIQLSPLHIGSQEQTRESQLVPQQVAEKIGGVETVPPQPTAEAAKAGSRISADGPRLAVGGNQTSRASLEPGHRAASGETVDTHAGEVELGGDGHVGERQSTLGYERRQHSTQRSTAGGGRRTT